VPGTGGLGGKHFRRLTLVAFAAVALTYVSVIGEEGWNQTAHLALVKSLYRGTPQIDRYVWMTGDTAYVNGHYYAAKAPGFAFAAMPAYALLHVTGAEQAIARRSSQREGVRVLLWGLGLFTVVVPALLLLVLVRSVTERLEPGMGTLAAVSVGLGTLLLPFSTMFFAHVLSALLAFAAFALLWREREGAGDSRLVALAGLLAGLAVVVDFSLVLVGVVLGVYALVRARSRLYRGAAYAAGTLVGVLPVAVYNWWAFGSVTHLSYANAVLVPGRTGHDVVGANSQGLFGVLAPSPRVALDLLFASRGLFTMSPLLIMAVVGLVFLFRCGKRAEALTISAVTVGLLVVDSGYYLPFGGWVPGPRFLLVTIPFLAVPLVLAFGRYPVVTTGLAIASVAMFAAATITVPLLPTGDTSEWAQLIRYGLFSQTILRFVGLDQGWVSVVPFLVGLVCALAAAIASANLTAVTRRALVIAGALVGTWVVGASVIAREQGNASRGAGVLIACAGFLSLLALTLVTLAARRAESHARAALRPTLL